MTSVAPVTTGPPCPVCGEPTRRSGKQGRPPTYDKPECRAKAKYASAGAIAAPAASSAPSSAVGLGRPVMEQSRAPATKQHATSPNRADAALRTARRLFFAGSPEAHDDDHRAFVAALEGFMRFGDDHPLASASELPDLEELRAQ